MKAAWASSLEGFPATGGLDMTPTNSSMITFI
jgi:hypothetical protein